MISIIFPIFNEEENLNELISRVSLVANETSDYEFEFIFVDDHSTDKSQEILRNIHQNDRRVKVIRFVRNFGGHAALTAGLNICSGDCAIVMAGDLQDPPEIINDLLEEWKKGSKIVWAVRSKRKGEKYSTLFFSKLYYFLMNIFTDVTMPTLGTDVFLADRRVIEANKQVKEKHSSIYMTFAWLGFNQASIKYVKEVRHGGKSNWTLQKKVKLLLDSILSFSYHPIRIISVLGFLIAFLGFVLSIVIFWRFYIGNPVEGWSSLMVVILVIGGVQMIMLGILGEYLWRTFDEARNRPRYIIDYTLD